MTLNGIPLISAKNTLVTFKETWKTFEITVMAFCVLEVTLETS